MTWMFQLHATQQRRLFARILQILDSQMVGIRSFSGETNHTGIRVTFVVQSEHDKAYRIHSLLCRLQDVHSVLVRPEC
jgi:hypothetical protein